MELTIPGSAVESFITEPNPFSLLRSCLVYIQILINDTVTRSSIIIHGQVFTRFVYKSRDLAIIVE